MLDGSILIFFFGGRNQIHYSLVFLQCHSVQPNGSGRSRKKSLLWLVYGSAGFWPKYGSAGFCLEWRSTAVLIVLQSTFGCCRLVVHILADSPIDPWDNLRALRLGDSWILCCSELSIDGFCGSQAVKGPVRRQARWNALIASWIYVHACQAKP